MANLSVDLKTIDGTMPVRVFQSVNTTRKGCVIFYMDAFGLRPELDDMARRYADAGYVVFLPDLYYRRKRRSFPVPAREDDPLDPEMAEANAATTLDMTIADSGSIVAHAVATPSYGVTRFGAVGYCMGARHALAAGATYGETIKAVACLHGGKLVWDGPNSPHTFIPRLSGAIYFGFAAHDPACPDTHKSIIEQTIAAAGVRGETEHYRAAHGWTFPTRWCYDPAAAEMAFSRVLSFFDAEMSGVA